MAVWLPAQNSFYLPPTPVTRILSTDDFVRRTSIFYHGSTDKLLTVGHPYYPIVDATHNVTNVPKVSSNQYRVFRCRLPDPNKFAFGDNRVYDPDKERLVWGCRGVEVGRGGPLGIGLTGHPFFNKLTDVENPFQAISTITPATDTRFNMAFDPKQTQLLIVGCKPALGEHWKRAPPCTGETSPTAQDCPPIEIETSVIQDGDMADIGLGHLDFGNLQESKSEAPIDIANSICKYPDFIQMTEDLYGDRLFFYARRESMYARHMFAHAGNLGKEPVPANMLLKQNATTSTTDLYNAVPSGSLVSSESQLLNRPYWIQQSQGANNGICWKNDLFITVVDTTRGTNFLITNAKDASSKTADFKSENFYGFLRHVEEFQISIILQLCKVSLTPESMAYIHTMDPTIVDDWHLSVAQPNNAVHEQYRYITSHATKCPSNVEPVVPVDPYLEMTFWTLDMTEKLTADLDQTSLGRKFLYQNGLSTSQSTARVGGKRARTLASTSIPTSSPGSKRRRK